jgi:creatinine amidohydrolase/Fe(II)-dependent formamide hydrolase-like protein
MNQTAATKNAEINPLSHFQVIDKLEVGPVQLQKNRLTACYNLFIAGKSHPLELAYKYEEEVFDPDDINARNLADMIAAQVALNYGLFCKTIVFNGIFDSQDRRFLRDMAENTAREIYVNKLLQTNKFIRKEYLPAPVVKLKSYCSATLSFPNQSDDDRKSSWQLWETSSPKHAILSSGGKDSLLSFALINEAGYEVHPVFINESGRHWYTALNAYRYFKVTFPNTARVWTNADRLFSGILRHLSFIRPDFEKLRSDYYPVRLWTVAVFLFGAIPILRKRGIGRLVIGDEFDTTIRTSYKEISHYDGLFDQSRYFDNMLSRYYLSKGWSIAQFSILRPLSEMLIMKILTQRYPDLQRHQISCHAAHLENGRVHPCGRCEKCRRIVGMLMALGGDPANCGYSPAQIQYCLGELQHKGIHQESVGQQQMRHMLWSKSLISSPKPVSAREEILHLRFDPEKSPVETMPEDLRRALFPIGLEYALGALRRTGRKWFAIDLMRDPVMGKPYPFETAGGSGDSGGERKRTTYLFGELTWPEVEAILQQVDIAILPVGAIEQHGPHLPLDTDAFDAEYLAHQVAAACSDPKPLVLPLIPYGVSYHHDDFKGTISIGNDTLSRMVYEIGAGVARNGIKKLVIINGHGGNAPALNYAAQMINRDTKIFVSVDTGESSDPDIYKIAETPNDVHAGEIETSTSLAVRPQLVRMEYAAKAIPQFSNRYLNFTSKRGVAWYAYTKRISETGVMGDPTKASREKGQKMWKIMIGHLVAFVEELKRMTLDEIHQRRY